MPALPLFAEITGFRLCRGFPSTPIRWVHSLRHIPMERGIRPIANSCDVIVLHRIPMEVIDMAVEIVLVADLMFPKPPLPSRTFSMFFLGRIHPLLVMK